MKPSALKRNDPAELEAPPNRKSRRGIIAVMRALRRRHASGQITTEGEAQEALVEELKKEVPRKRRTERRRRNQRARLSRRINRGSVRVGGGGARPISEQRGS